MRQVASKNRLVLAHRIMLLPNVPLGWCAGIARKEAGGKAKFAVMALHGSVDNDSSRLSILVFSMVFNLASLPGASKECAVTRFSRTSVLAEIDATLGTMAPLFPEDNSAYPNVWAKPNAKGRCWEKGERLVV